MKIVKFRLMNVCKLLFYLGLNLQIQLNVQTFVKCVMLVYFIVGRSSYSDVSIFSDDDYSPDEYECETCAVYRANNTCIQKPDGKKWRKSHPENWKKSNAKQLRSQSLPYEITNKKIKHKHLKCQN